MVENKDAVNEAIEKLKPALSQFSFGGLMGYCSGMAMKKVGKGLAYVVGMGFMALQGAAFMGYIEIDWAKVKQDALKPLDKSGDGKVDAEELKLYWQKLKAILTAGLPDAAGFSVGFLAGIKYS